MNWLYVAVAFHVLIALAFVSLLLYYNHKTNTVGVKIATKVDSYLKQYGYDAAPFLPVWYNKLSSVVKLNYPDNTVCVVVLSNRDMFEKTLPAHLASTTSSEDPIDSCTKYFMQRARELFPDEEVDIIYDYDLQPNSPLPLVNMQTVGHSAGLAYYYRPEEVTEPSWGDRKMFGCSISPKYGGWFGFRAVLVFKNVQDAEIQYLSPHDSLPSQEEKAKVLELFNNEWKDPAWRDVVLTDEMRYSDEQLDYFNKLPAERGAIVEEMRRRYIEQREDETRDDKKEL